MEVLKEIKGYMENIETIARGFEDSSIKDVLIALDEVATDILCIISDHETKALINSQIVACQCVF